MGKDRKPKTEQTKADYARDLENFYCWFLHKYPDVAVIAGALTAETFEGEGSDEDGVRYGEPVIVSQGNLLAMGTLAATLRRTMIQADE